MEVASTQSNFLLAFSNSVVRHLTAVSTSSEDEAKEALSKWLTRPWLSKHWESTRARSKIQAEDVLRVCLANPNQYTLAASEMILRACEHDLTDRATWERRINAAKRSQDTVASTETS